MEVQLICNQAPLEVQEHSRIKYSSTEILISFTKHTLFHLIFVGAENSVTLGGSLSGLLDALA
jgi:hypothetical protein